MHDILYRWYIFENYEEYDIKSLMHYPGTAFSSNGEPTIIDRSTNQPVPYNTRISSNDFAQVLNPSNAFNIFISI